MRIKRNQNLFFEMQYCQNFCSRSMAVSETTELPSDRGFFPCLVLVAGAMQVCAARREIDALGSLGFATTDVVA